VAFDVGVGGAQQVQAAVQISKSLKKQKNNLNYGVNLKKTHFTTA
jgi:hypothetical protein